jgi:hypothetical protein
MTDSKYFNSTKSRLIQPGYRRLDANRYYEKKDLKIQAIEF